jgi:hypothetical protein
MRDLGDLEDISVLPEQLQVDLGLKDGVPSPTAESTARPPGAHVESSSSGAVTHPGRHRHLMHIACAMRGRGEGHEAILAELRWHNAHDCVPPKSDEHVEELAKGHYRAV